MVHDPSTPAHSLFGIFRLEMLTGLGSPRDRHPKPRRHLLHNSIRVIVAEQLYNCNQWRPYANEDSTLAIDIGSVADGAFSLLCFRGILLLFYFVFLNKFFIIEF